MPSNEGGWERSRPTIITYSNKDGGQKAAWKAGVDAAVVKRQAGADVSRKPVQIMYARTLAPWQKVLAESNALCPGGTANQGDLVNPGVLRR